MKKIIRKLILIAALLFLFQLLIQPVLAEGAVVLDYFYNEKCPSCIDYFNETKKGAISLCEMGCPGEYPLNVEVPGQHNCIHCTTGNRNYN